MERGRERPQTFIPLNAILSLSHLELLVIHSESNERRSWRVTAEQNGLLTCRRYQEGRFTMMQAFLLQKEESHRPAPG